VSKYLIIEVNLLRERGNEPRWGVCVCVCVDFGEGGTKLSGLGVLFLKNLCWRGTLPGCPSLYPCIKPC